MTKSPSNNAPRTTNRKHLARQAREQNQMRYLLIAMIAVAVFIVGVIGYGILDQTVLKNNRAVASVNGESVSLKQLQTRVRYERWRMVNQYLNLYNTMQMFGSDSQFSSYFTNQMTSISDQLNDSTGLAGQVLDTMIEDKLIAQKAKELGITVSDKELEESVQGAFNYYPQGTPTPTITPTTFSTPTFSSTLLSYITLTPIPSETAIPTETAVPSATATVENVTPTPLPPTATLAPTNTTAPTSTITPTPTEYTYDGYQNEYKTAIANLGEIQFSEKDIRALFRAQLLREKVMNALTADMKPEDEQVYARHILVADEATAQTVRERLLAGESFDAVAAELSTDTSNATSGGILGWFSKGAMVKEFEDAAFSLQVGEISQPVQTSFGFHIIQVLDKQTKLLTSSEFETAKSTFFTNWLAEQSAAKTVKKFDLATDVIPVEPAIPSEYLLQ